MTETIKEYNFGETKIYFRIDEVTKNIGFSVQLSHSITNLYKNMAVTNLFQIKKIGDKYPKGFSNGRTMINSESSANVKFVEQLFSEDNYLVVIETLGEDENNNYYRNVIEYNKKYDVIETWNEFKCKNLEAEKIEYFPSVTMEGISPYTNDSEKLHLTKYRSKWTMEGKRDTQTFADLLLEQSWKPSGVSIEKFGYTGSMPVNGLFPMVSVYDEENNYSISCQMHVTSSWQIEVVNKELKSSLSLGLPDRDFGNLMYLVENEEEIVTPKIRIAVTKGNIEDCNRKLTRIQELVYEKSNQFGMPIIFNEFCSTWGAPNHDNVIERAKVAHKLGMDYFVIDAGWYNDVAENPDQSIGDWNIDLKKFPKGLIGIKKELSELDLKLGIWFEFEHCAVDSNIYNRDELMLTRDGTPLETLKRRFFDFKKRSTTNYMEEKIQKFINENKIDYVKVDYNDSVGHGVDHEYSQGLGVVESINANYAYYKSLVERNPEVLFESCASGGHRLTLPFTELTNMSSFSDAHETAAIPIVSANLSNLFLLKQLQIWAVLKPEYSDQKMRYVLASAFIGRMCISGLIEELSEKQIELVAEYVTFYKSLEEIIMDCDCHVFRSQEGSYNTPKGYQIVEVKHRKSDKQYKVIQSFNLEDEKVRIDLGKVEIISILARKEVNIENNIIELTNDFDSVILTLI